MDDIYTPPDILTQRLNGLAEASAQVDSIKSPRAKTALLRAMDLMVGSMADIVHPRKTSDGPNLIQLNRS